MLCTQHRLIVGDRVVRTHQTLSMDQQSALHETANCGRYDILQYYLSECGGDPNLRDSRGRTPLHSAAYGGHIECCKLLVDHGAKWNVPDMRKRMPLHEVMSSRFHRCSFKRNLLSARRRLLMASQTCASTSCRFHTASGR
jgi:ankyrin repeat protein